MSQQKNNDFEYDADGIYAMLESHHLEQDPENWSDEDVLAEFKKIRKAIQLLAVTGILKPYKFHEAMELAELFD